MLMKRSQEEIENEGRRLAEEGYGWCDLVALMSITEEEARRYVMQAEFRRLGELHRSRKDDRGAL
jgi:hypothetical protein